MKTLLSILFSSMLALALAGCESNEGEFEQFGEDVDNAVEETTDGIEDTADDLKDTADDMGNEIEDACEDATDSNC